MSEERNFDGLVLAIERTSADLGQHAKRAVNLCLTLRNWLIGRHIAEYELKGNDRSRYGERLLSELAKALTRKGVSSVSKRQLYGYLRFYRAYPEIVPTLSAQFTLDYKATVVEKVPTLSALFQESAQSELLRLSYSHIREIVAVEDAQKRTFYEQHCLRAGWSVRELRRQIATLYYERTALSTNKAELEKQALEKAEREPLEFPIRDPYVFEFLGLKPIDVMGESDLEDALLSKLQEFLLELGHGFCFEARQKRILIGDTHNFVDLVFYHRVLKCHVLIELKVDKFTHEHIGQLNTYVSWYADNQMTEGDNPPVGILLCTEKDHTVVKYALAGMSNQLFVSKYQVALPTEAQIQGALWD